MALNRKYAALPDLDSAPDIYETPELTDDNSTVPTLANRAPSDDEFYDVDDDDRRRAISRSRLRLGEARSRFMPANLDASDVDFSDRVDGKRKSYKASSRRQRILHDGTEELGDLSDDEGESLERRIARLTREVQEAKDDYARLKDGAAAEPRGEEDGAPTGQRLDSLSRLLGEMAMPVGTVAAPAPAAARLAALPRAAAEAADGTRGGEGAATTYTVTYAPTYEQSHALAKAADFDRRLVALERALGISSSFASEAGRDGLPRAMLPTLELMEKQVSTLSQASTASLDAMSRRVRALASEQEKLNETREKARALRDEMHRHTPPTPSDEADKEAKVNALYAILPTIEGLAPMLPPLLDRLRSLRAMHAAAAAASQTLDGIEAQQADMAAELAQWREGLAKMEAAVAGGDATVKGNVKVMEAWVAGLEERMAKLPA